MFLWISSYEDMFDGNAKETVEGIHDGMHLSKKNKERNAANEDAEIEEMYHNPETNEETHPTDVQQIERDVVDTMDK